MEAGGGALPSFGEMLTRIIDKCMLDIHALADQMRIPESEVREVLDGAVPSETFLRDAASVLRLHAADLFAIAWLDLPEDLSPLDSRAAWGLPHLASAVMHLSVQRVHDLREYAASLPQEERTRQEGLPAPFERFERSPGGVLLRLFANRNMARRAAYTIMAVTDRGLSPSTLFSVGTGRKAPTKAEIGDYVSVLDIDRDILNIMTGYDVASISNWRDPRTIEIARLIWDVRGLSGGQIRIIRDKAESMDM